MSSGAAWGQMWDTGDVAQFLGVSRARVHQLLRNPHSRFPQPIEIRKAFLWYAREIKDWARISGRLEASDTANARTSVKDVDATNTWSRAEDNATTVTSD